MQQSVSCPDHGSQSIVAMGATTVTLACGASGNSELGITHRPDAGETVRAARYIVAVWRHKSESTYWFGPFETEEEAEAFAVKVDEHPDADCTMISVINGPSMFGTGMEVS